MRDCESVEKVMPEDRGKERDHLMDLVKVLVSLIEEKDFYLKGHSERVGAMGASFS